MNRFDQFFSKSIPSVSEKELVILQLLVNGDELYGLEMVKTASGHLKRGTVYVTLNRMENTGLVESRLVTAPEGKTGPSRRAYRITAEGHRLFDAVNVFASSLKIATEGGVL